MTALDFSLKMKESFLRESDNQYPEAQYAKDNGFVVFIIGAESIYWYGYANGSGLSLGSRETLHFSANFGFMRHSSNIVSSISGFSICVNREEPPFVRLISHIIPFDFTLFTYNEKRYFVLNKNFMQKGDRIVRIPHSDRDFGAQTKSATNPIIGN